jgi:release factor glutamine methyltransferase
MLQNNATYRETRNYLIQEISDNYPKNEAVSIARIIMDHCGFAPHAYLLEPHQTLGTETVAQINEIVKEIRSFRPIQYILGYTWFCEMKITVNENVLIPRPETEEMIRHIIDSYQGIPASILDLGTGSGCIALALKKQYSDASVSGVDTSQKALDVAVGNGEDHHLSVNWIHGDLLNQESLKLEDNYDLVVSNPPYVTEEEKSRMDQNVLGFEPPEALFVTNHNPLKYYSAIAELASNRLSASGTLWLEINEQFGLQTAQLLQQLGFTFVEIYKDIHEKDRFIQASWR